MSSSEKAISENKPWRGGYRAKANPTLTIVRGHIAMSNNDYISIAQKIRRAFETKEPFNPPLMKVADLGRVLKLLKAIDIAV